MHRVRRTRPWMAGAVIVAVVAVTACGGTEFPTSVIQGGRHAGSVGPFVFDPNHPTKPDTHWHAALGVYDCDHWMGDVPGSGIWNWPAATAEGSPARAADPGRYAGLHSHDDGVIHMEPVVPAEAGENATLGLYFTYGGWSVSSTGFSFLGTTRSTGDPCAGTPGVISWAVAKWNGTAARQTYRPQTGDPASYKLLNGDVVVVAFLPANRSLSDIGNPPSILGLARALGVPTPPAVGA